MKLLLLLLAVLTVSSRALADSPVWKVSQKDHVLYLGGTIHVLAPSDYPLPAAFDRAYQQADKLVLEIDPHHLRSGSALLQGNFIWPAGESLQSKVSASTWQLFTKWCQGRGLPVETLRLYKPGGLLMVLLPLELMRIGINAEGVDKHYGDRALDDGLEVAGLETLQYQLEVIGNLGIGDEDDFLRYLITSMDSMARQFDEMRTAWRSGDRSELIRKSELDLMRSDYPDVYRSLVVERNNNWMPRLEAMVHDPAAELVLVGALHLVGPDGLLNQFAERGYQVEQLR